MVKANIPAGQEHIEGLGLEMLNNSDLRLIHEATMEVLENIGIETKDPEALQLYADAGCEVDFEKGVAKIPEYVVMDAIRSSPSRVRLAAVDKKKDLVLRSGPYVNWAPFGVGIEFLEFDANGKHRVRASTEADLKKSMTICDWCDGFSVADPTIAARDWTENGRADLHEVSTALCNTTKPFTFGEPEANGFEDYFEMAKLVYGGDEELARKRPLVNVCNCPTSPLQICDNSTQITIRAARNMIPNVVISMSMAGGTGPVTPEGTLVTQNAEVLADIVLAQLAEKGAPVTYGTATTIMDLRNGIASGGAPEMALFSAAVAQVSRFYGIPCGDAAGCWTDSKVPDAQAGFEKGLTAMVPALAGANLIFGGGLLEMGQTISLEQLVIDNDVIGMINSMLKGMNITDSRILMDDIEEVGIGGHFIARASTRKAMSEQSSPLVFDRNMRGPWEKKGEKDAALVAHEKVEWILENHDPCGLDRDVVKDLEAFVARRDKEFLK
ncbi:MAG: trimethylamine methyltransferase family protein [Methanosarcinaceae archaeon]|nr:trimethylamine methyltransferase family protein [Methanosarcinaceae archaeon]MDD4497246.1 trimethylamine methyltransferase family protein [Methanosarcinaceae archaeon]